MLTSRQIDGRKLVVALSATFMLGSATRADADTPSLYVGLYGGGNIVVDDWDLHRRPDSGTPPGSGLDLGFRGGVDLFSWFSLQGNLSLLPFTSEAGEGNTAIEYGADALLFYKRDNWWPYLLAGVGLYQNLSGDHGRDADYHFNWGLGTVGRVHDLVAVRLQARHLMSDGYEKTSLAFSNNIEITGGIELVLDLGAKKEPAKPEPMIVAEKPAEPEKRAEPEPEPEPEKDDEAEVVPEWEDEAQPAPAEPAPAATPVAAPATIPEPQTFEGALPDLYFTSSKAGLTLNARQVLDEVAETMKKFETMEVTLHGHADDRGTIEKNDVLSNDRATTVKRYLVKQGVDAKRLKTVGHGQKKPRKANDSDEHRAYNRRVEFEITKK